MYLLGLLIIDKLFLRLINTFDFTNNLTIGIRATLIDIKVVNFIFLYFLGLVCIFFDVSIFCILAVLGFLLFFLVDVSNHREKFRKYCFFFPN